MNFNMNIRILQNPKNIKISIPKNINHIIITWDNVINPDINSTISNPIVNIKYNIYRSTAINGIFYKINNEPLDNNWYEDIFKVINPNTTYWYKISTIAIFNDNSISESRLSEPNMYKVKNENKWFNKMNERNMWILKNTGVLMDLYVKKTVGEHCPKCYDLIRGQSNNTNCDICYGTGIVGGYEPKYQLYVRQKPVQQQLDLSNTGYALNSNPGAWTISSIHIHNRDLLINPEGRIFIVTASNINHAAGVYFHQELQMQEVDTTSSYYKIERVNIYPEF